MKERAVVKFVYLSSSAIAFTLAFTIIIMTSDFVLAQLQFRGQLYYIWTFVQILIYFMARIGDI